MKCELFKGWVLDAKPLEKGVALTLSDGTQRIEVALENACFDLLFKPKKQEIATQLLEHPDVKQHFVEEWFEPPWYTTPTVYRVTLCTCFVFEPPWYTTTTKVMRFVFTSLKSVEQIQKAMLEQAIAEVYGRFPDRITQLFWKLGFPPNTFINSRAEILENPQTEDYAQPDYSCAEIRFYDCAETFFPLTHAKPTKFSLFVKKGGERFEITKEEITKLGCYITEFENVDVLCYATRYHFLLKEAGANLSSPLVLHRNSPTSEGVEEALVRLVEWSKISYTPLRSLASSSIGKPLTANEARLAHKRRYLIPETQVRLESWKSLDELVTHDKGGLLFRPKAGVYFNVAQLDFRSMYPSLIAKWNISPETVNSPLSVYNVPGTKHLIEFERRGVVPEALEWLIERRERLRALSKERKDKTLELRQRAIKWLLVASFGYLGFRNAKFGKIDAYECVTALARHVMNRALDVAKQMGFRVLHVMVDSIFLQKENMEQKELEELIESVARKTGLELKLEALYDWVVFSKNRHSFLCSPQRYYGRVVTGELKVKGLECVKRSAPNLIGTTQREALEVLKRARTPCEFFMALKEAKSVFDKTRELIESEGLEPWLFAFCVKGAKRALGRSVDACVWVIKGEEGFYPAQHGYHKIDKKHYLTLLEGAWEQIEPCF